MKAIVITGVGGPEVLELREVATPEPRGDQVRVRVRACGVNRADLLQASGFYPAPAGVPSDIPGMEYAGEVDALGPDVTGPLKVGDRVFGIVAGGAQAEYLVTHERTAVPIPADLDFVAAAAVPEVFLTAHDALITQGRLGPGEPVLILALGLLLSKRLSLIGTTLRARPLEEKIAATRLFARQVVPWLERGAVRPVVDAVFPWEEVRDGYARLASNQAFGKVILRF